MNINEIGAKTCHCCEGEAPMSMDSRTIKDNIRETTEQLHIIEGMVANSCSTMHKIAAKEFTLDDFSHEHLVDDLDVRIEIGGTDHRDTGPMEVLGMTIDVLNHYREKYLVATKTEEYTGLPTKDIWWQMIQLLPSSYNQKRTVMLNYEVLANIYKSRRYHKLDEWHTLCDRIESLPYSALITGTAV